MSFCRRRWNLGQVYVFSFVAAAVTVIFDVVVDIAVGLLVDAFRFVFILVELAEGL